MIRRAWRVAALVGTLAAAAGAQRSEVRMDAIGSTPVWHAGAGVTWALGYYARVGAIASYGFTAESGADPWRGDLLARVTLDPFRRHRFGLSFGGGLSWIERPWLLLVAEVEGPIWRGLTMALQGGVGGGPRIGIVLRPGLEDRR